MVIGCSFDKVVFIMRGGIVRVYIVEDVSMVVRVNRIVRNIYIRIQLLSKYLKFIYVYRYMYGYRFIFNNNRKFREYSVINIRIYLLF